MICGKKEECTTELVGRRWVMREEGMAGGMLLKEGCAAGGREGGVPKGSNAGEEGVAGGGCGHCGRWDVCRSC